MNINWTMTLFVLYRNSKIRFDIRSYRTYYTNTPRTYRLTLDDRESSSSSLSQSSKTIKSIPTSTCTSLSPPRCISSSIGKQEEQKTGDGEDDCGQLKFSFFRKIRDTVIIFNKSWHFFFSFLFYKQRVLSSTRGTFSFAIFIFSNVYYDYDTARGYRVYHPQCAQFNLSNCKVCTYVRSTVCKSTYYSMVNVYASTRTYKKTLCLKRVIGNDTIITQRAV